MLAEAERLKKQAQRGWKVYTSWGEVPYASGCRQVFAERS